MFSSLSESCFQQSPCIYLRMFSLHCILHLLLLFLPAIAQNTYNISLGSSLSTSDQNPYWVSPSGEFAFGFHELPNGNQFLLAIWFAKIPDETIVWSANGDNPVQRRSKVELTTSGNLVLSDLQGKEVWRAVSNDGSTAVSAAMLDSGNFVLFNAGSVIWASFENPADTILPTQILKLGTSLRSRLTETDYSRGRFSLKMQSDGDFALHLVSLPTDFQYPAYWNSNTSGSGSELVFNSSGLIHLKLKDGGSSILAPIKNDSISELYQRATIDSDGVFKKYVWPKNQSGPMLSWSVVWSLPQDICSINFGVIGSGACGFNSYCKMDEKQRPSCYCPPGYSFLDPNNKYKGCKQDFPPQSCDRDALKGMPQYEMRELVNAHWPDSNYEGYGPVSEEQCGEFCLNDCWCMAAGFRDGNCYKKRSPLSNGRMRPGAGATTFIKVSKDNSSIPPSNVGGKKKDGALNPLGSVLLGSSVFLAVLFSLLIIFISYQRKSKVVRPGSSMLVKSLQSFTYKELEEATEGFKEQLGRGSFGTVYKGSLALADSATSIAVKKLEQVVADSEAEFTTEVVAIGQTHHKNLAKLIGFCNEGQHRLLVYEYMSNGSLSSFLFRGSKPMWNQRTQIALGIARGLTYLHEECINQIIHCDIKPQNILLDDKFTARISDFGLAKLLHADQTRTNTVIRGTRGYVAPEWLKKMPVTAKVDVYSYGVMLLEIICSRKSVEPEAEGEEEVILSDWVNDCYREGRLNLIAEGQEDAMVDRRELERSVKVAIWCIQEEPTLRPSMKKVTQMLEGAVEVLAPPNLSSFSSLN